MSFKTFKPESPEDILAILQEEEYPPIKQRAWMVGDFHSMPQGVFLGNFFFSTKRKMRSKEAQVPITGGSGELAVSFGVGGSGHGINGVPKADTFGSLRFSTKNFQDTRISFAIEDDTYFDQLPMAAFGLYKYLYGETSQRQTADIDAYLEAESDRVVADSITALEDLLKSLNTNRPDNK